MGRWRCRRGRGNVGTRLTEAFMFGGGPQRTKRHRDRLYPHAETQGNLGIWDSIQPATVQIFEAGFWGNYRGLREVLRADLQYRQNGISGCTSNIPRFGALPH